MSDRELSNLLIQRQKTVDELNMYMKSNSNKELRTLDDIKRRKRIYVLIKLLLKIERILNKRKVKVINDQRYYTKNSKIYVCNVAGENTVESIIEVIGEGVLIIKSAPNRILTKEEKILMYGGILDFYDEESLSYKEIIAERSLRNLELGGSLLYFSENIEPTNIPNQLDELTKYFISQVTETQATVIPVAIESYRTNTHSNYYVNIGKNFEFGKISMEHIPDIIKIINIDINNLKEEIHQKKLERK